MARQLSSYLKTHRKRSGFTQRELAQLFGNMSDAKVSRCERLQRKPCLETAFACQVIFDVSPHELFPGMYAPVEQAVVERAHLLVQTLYVRKTTPRIEHKLHTLRTIIKRASGAR